MATTLFTCRDNEITPAHALAAAAYWGEVDALAQAVAARCAAADAAREHDIAVADATVQARSEDFRRKHGLSSSAATLQWLEAHGVTVEAFTDYLEREELYARTRRQLPDAIEVDEAALEKALWPHAVFSGAAEGWCRWLAQYLAVAAETGAPRSEEEGATLSDGVAHWCARLGAPESWLHELMALEAGFIRFQQAALTAQRMDQVMRAKWEDLIQVECELGAFESEMAAREAALCVRMDGAALEEVCETGGGMYHTGGAFVSALPAAARPHAMAAAEGELLPPIPRNGSFLLYRVLGKRSPSLDDDAVRQAVSGAVLGEAVRPLVRRHVTGPLVESWT